MSKTEKGAVIGAGTGAVVGGVIGNQAGNTAVGAILGAAIGGAAGAAIGNYMDKQAEEMERDLEGATITRVGEGIKVTFDSGLLFDVNKADLQYNAQQNLTNLSVILNKYEDTPRMTTIGYGETQPVADNSTSTGKQANRRVEVAIMANDKLRDTAEKQGGLN
jgi:outer membrane protein OmpA-like peptidoglycan-associated protein